MEENNNEQVEQTQSNESFVGIVEDKKKTSNVVVVILVLIIVGLLGYIGYDKLYASNKVNTKINNSGNVNKTEEPTNVTDDSKNVDINKEELDDQTKKELLDLIGLTENGLQRMEKSRVVEDGLDSSCEWIDGSSAKNSLFWVFRNNENGTYTANDITFESKKDIFLNSVISKNELAMVYAGDDENHPCYAGAGYCYGVSDELYQKVAKRYGLSQNPLSMFSEKFDNKYYLITFGGSILNPFKIEDKLTFDIKDDVNIIYDVKLTPNSLNYEGNKDVNQTITYTFKLVDGQYNLSTFTVLNK